MQPNTPFPTRGPAEAWRAAQPPPAPKPPLLTLPSDHLRVALLAVGFVGWVLVGTLLAKAGLVPAPPIAAVGP